MIGDHGSFWCIYVASVKPTNYKEAAKRTKHWKKSDEQIYDIVKFSNFKQLHIIHRNTIARHFVVGSFSTRDSLVFIVSYSMFRFSVCILINYHCQPDERTKEMVFYILAPIRLMVSLFAHRAFKLSLLHQIEHKWCAIVESNSYYWLSFLESAMSELGSRVHWEI